MASRSGGNPFFVAEFLQTMADTGRLRLGPEGQWLLDTTDHPLGELPEPESIQTLLANRLKRLSNTSRRLCQVAAVLGRRMESKVLCHTSGLKRFRFTCALDELIQLHIVQVDPTLGSETVVFVHDTLREVAYAQAGDAREAIHHQAAQTLEAQEQFDPAASALHWVLGGDPRRGKLRYIEAARRDTERWAMRNACRHLEAALNLGIPADHPLEDLELSMERVRLLRLLGEHAKAVEGALAVLERLGSDLPRPETTPLALRAHLDAASALEQSAQLEAAQHHLQQATDLLGQIEVEALPLQAQHARVQGRITQTLGDLEHAAELYAQAASIYARAGLLAEQAQSLVKVANIHLLKGRFEEAIAICHEAQLLFNEVHDQHGEAELWLQLGTCHRIRSALDEAASCYATSLALHHNTGNKSGEIKVLIELGKLHDQQGLHQQACDNLTQALELSKRLGTRQWEALTMLALNNGYRGRFRQGLECMAHAETQALREHGTSDLARQVRGQIKAYIASMMGDTQSIQACLELFSSLGDVHEPRSNTHRLWHLYTAQLFAFRRQFAEAEAAYKAYRKVLEGRGQQLLAQLSICSVVHLLLDQGRMAEAQTLFDSIPEASRNQSSAPSMAHFSTTQASVLRHQGRLDEARVCAETSLELLGDGGLVSSRASALYELCMVAHAQGEAITPWLDVLRQLTEGMEIYPESRLGRIWHDLEAIAPGSICVTFLEAT
ncbi:MAG: tetratricopeptide repeat protein [Myxococcota bacterium]